MPKRARIVPTIAGDTTIINSPVPPALSSSATIASSYIPAPPPPYSTGRLTPRNPSLPASSQSSLIGSCVAALARVYSQPYFADSSATTRRSSCCSLVSVKSINPPSLRSPATQAAVGCSLRWRSGRSQRLRLLRFGIAVDDGEHGPDIDLLAWLDGKLRDDARSWSVDLVLHLHRLQPQQWLAALDAIADLDDDAGDGPRHRRQQ